MISKTVCMDRFVSGFDIFLVIFECFFLIYKHGRFEINLYTRKELG